MKEILPMDKANHMIRVRGARTHNLKDVSLELPRNQLVVFTGVSGSGKSSLAFGTLYAEAQRRYLESVSPYARRLFNQMSTPEVDAIEGLPPAVALQQQRGGSSTRSSVGSVTTLSNLIRMLYSRAGDYPPGQPIIYAEGFSPNTPQGACETCHGLGTVFEVTEKSMVPNDRLTIRERAIASWPKAWQGQNQRDILVSMGIDVDVPWKNLPKKTRDWILFTEETPTAPVYPGFSPAQTAAAIARKMAPDYMGTFIGAKSYVLKTFSNSPSELMKKRVAEFMVSSTCPTCGGKRLKKEALSVKFDGKDIAEIYQHSLSELAVIFHKYLQGNLSRHVPEKQLVIERISADILSRIEVMLELGLGYLSVARTTPTLSPGELQRLRLATQVHSNLFGVVYVLDEPSAGLHPADTQALLRILDRLKDAGNTIFVVEHEIEVIRHADWIVDVGPDAGEKGGEILYSGTLGGLKRVTASRTAPFLFQHKGQLVSSLRKPKAWLSVRNASRHNLVAIDIDFPIGVLTCVTGISGSGKSSLVSQILVELVSAKLGQRPAGDENEDTTPEVDAAPVSGTITAGMEHISRLVVVDQRPIGRTPRSNLATYTGIFDPIRKRFADTPLAKQRKYDAGRFSFNVAKGRCPNCQGEGFVMVELLFLPSVYTPCPTCGGTRYNPQTLEVQYQGKNISQILEMTVEQACSFFEQDLPVYRALDIVRSVGLGYLRLGQSATELSGGEAQRIKLASELQKIQNGSTLYVLDEPTTGLHPSDVERLMAQLHLLVAAGNTVIVVEHDMQTISQSDWLIDMGPGAGADGGQVVFQGIPANLSKSASSKTAPFLAAYLAM
jgi:excinuclease ABC subunit A